MDPACGLVFELHAVAFVEIEAGIDISRAHDGVGIDFLSVSEDRDDRFRCLKIDLAVAGFVSCLVDGIELIPAFLAAVRNDGTGGVLDEGIRDRRLVIAFPDSAACIGGDIGKACVHVASAVDSLAVGKELSVRRLGVDVEAEDRRLVPGFVHGISLILSIGVGREAVQSRAPVCPIRLLVIDVAMVGVVGNDLDVGIHVASVLDVGLVACLECCQSRSDGVDEQRAGQGRGTAHRPHGVDWSPFGVDPHVFGHKLDGVGAVVEGSADLP